MHAFGVTCGNSGGVAAIRPVAAVRRRAENDARMRSMKSKYPGFRFLRAAVRGSLGWFDGGDAMLFGIAVGCIFFCFMFFAIDLTLLILFIQFHIINTLQDKK